MSSSTSGPSHARCLSAAVSWMMGLTFCCCLVIALRMLDITHVTWRDHAFPPSSKECHSWCSSQLGPSASFFAVVLVRVCRKPTAFLKPLQPSGTHLHTALSVQVWFQALFGWVSLWWVILTPGEKGLLASWRTSGVWTRSALSGRLDSSED